MISAFPSASRTGLISKQISNAAARDENIGHQASMRRRVRAPVPDVAIVTGCSPSTWVACVAQGKSGNYQEAAVRGVRRSMLARLGGSKRKNLKTLSTCRPSRSWQRARTVSA